MADRIEVFTRNIDLAKKVQETIQKKVSKLNRYLKNIDDTRVDITYAKSARSAKDKFVAQITIRGRGFILRTEERSDEVLTAFDTALDKMQRQIERFKGKRRRGRSEARLAVEEGAVALEPDASETTAIARRKTFELTPMTEIEAIEQMQLLGHDNFFIFYNAETGTTSVLYRRRDGSYGLIEPRLG
ncbi:MAG: ribosome-associated translation inhibitor RaiA [Anaerolineales bacterium]|nr:ribosome-associated translation inhibitor RaiA [Anaerolineales bacterium]